MLDAVVARLTGQVSDLNNRVEQAAFLAELLRQGRAPQGALAVVIPIGLQGGAGDTGTGLFRQPFTETIAVLLFADAHDQAGLRALNRIRPLIDEVVTALAGWAPGDETGVFELRRGFLVSIAGGRLVYQLEFSISDQLRIAS